MRSQLWSPITQCRFVAWLQNPVQTANAVADGNKLLKLTRSRKMETGGYSATVTQLAHRRHTAGEAKS
jgi:hypothetical protein